MGKKQYKYQPLAGAKLVGRRHVRDIQLPGMRELKNCFISKSDHAITLRPDFDPIAEDLKAYATTEYLNSAASIYGSSDIAFFSTLGPLADTTTTKEIISKKYSVGTVTGISGNDWLSGAGTSWLQNVWSGCMVKVWNSADEYDTYFVDYVISDTKIALTSNLSETYAGVAYYITQNHNPTHAEHKLNIQQYTTGIVYSNPTNVYPVDSQKICGPFHATATGTTNEYSFTSGSSTNISNVGGDDGVWQQSIATDQTNVMLLVNDAADHQLLTTSTPGVHTALDSATTQPDAGDFELNINSACIMYDSATTSFYVGGTETSTSDMAVAVTDDTASSWTIRGHSGGTNGYVWSLAAGLISATNYQIAVGSDGKAYYSTDYFVTWTECTNLGAFVPLYVFYGNGQFLLLDGTGDYRYSDDGISFASTGSLGSAAATTGWQSAAYLNSDVGWCMGSVSALGACFARAKTLGADPATSDVHLRHLSAGVFSIANCGDRLLVTAKQSGVKPVIYNTTDGISLGLSYTAPQTDQVIVNTAHNVAKGETVHYMYDGGSTNPFTVYGGLGQSSTTWNIGQFSPLSALYRSSTHSVLNGYVMLMGLLEWDSTEELWEYFPRRIRWTAPLTYDDFTSTGSGSANLDGSGAILDSRPVNGRIVTFESSQIGAISPRGYTNDPWEYDIIRQNIRAISNPVVVDDVCYFIDDSGLMRTTNGMTVDEPPFAFDLTEYDDFNADIPIWLTYHPELDALMVYNTTADDNNIYVIELSAGSASKFNVADVANDGSPLDLKSVVCVENSSDRRMMISYVPRNDDPDKILVAELSTGSTITGIDELTSDATDDTYFVGDIQTPEDWIVAEGIKTSIKHVILRTYCDGTDEATNPIVAIQVQSLEDSGWTDAGDSTGTITVSDSACTGSGTAWSSTLFSATDVYDLPCLATQARVYDDTTLQVEGTDYTITGAKEITFSPSPSGDVTAYWENEPYIRVEVGDAIHSTRGWHRITGVTRSNAMTLDHYLVSGATPDATATHHPAEPMPVGDGEIKIGVSKLTEGSRFRFVIIPRSDGDATVAKITGYSVAHIPSGEKIVQAT